MKRRNLGQCSIHGCQAQAAAKEMCLKHYQRARKERLGRGAPVDSVECILEGCANSKTANGLCAIHYYRLKKYGDVRFHKYAARHDYTKVHPIVVNTYRNIYYRCTNPKDRKYKYYGGKGIKNFLRVEDLQYLWERDGAAQMKRPSIDRKDSSEHYTLDNCQFIEHVENVKKGWRERRKFTGGEA